MTLEENLLFKDLCARLSYGVKVKFYYYLIDEYEIIPLTAKLLSDTVYIGDIKPYLFPLSSMTKEQLCELKEITDFKYHSNTVELVEWTKTHTTLEFWLEEVPQDIVIEVFDWLNKNHFDYRYLIDKGLAIDATGKIFISYGDGESN